MSRRVLSHAKLLKELEDLPQYESDCELPSNNNSTNEDSDFVIYMPESQKSSSDSDETTSPLSMLTRRNSITDIASTSSCGQPIRYSRGTSRSTSKGRRSRGNRGRRLDHDKDTLGAESERVKETGSDDESENEANEIDISNRENEDACTSKKVNSTEMRTLVSSDSSSSDSDTNSKLSYEELENPVNDLQASNENCDVITVHDTV
ncbi:hypothetical protein RN001_003261 [Aquatica leii]|uniref:Uncharacterized protein n=1 Tax=Aquatica leii TaxID=1421715 RepID=A0AAN7PER2_9COLE|nr:hypothetical protein RN001_003261 [Aquatica leii]